MNEAKRVFTNSKNVQDRLWSSLRIRAEVLYHPSPVMEHLIARPAAQLGDDVVFPSRMEGLKRQSLVVEAMRHVKSPVTLVLVGKGPDEQALRRPGRSDGVARARAVRDRRRRRTSLPVVRGRSRRVLRPVRRGLRVRHDRGLRGPSSGGDAHRQRRSPRIRGRRARPVSSRAQNRRRSPKRSIGCTGIATWLRDWGPRGTRWCVPRFRAGPTSSPGCSTDAPRRRSQGRCVERNRQRRGRSESWCSRARCRRPRRASRRMTAPC